MSDPRNFDEFYNGNCAFILGGQTFHWRPLHWREWGELIDRRAAEETKLQEARKAKIAKLVKDGAKLDPPRTELEAEEIVDAEETLVSAFESVVERIQVYVEPGEVQAFRAVIDDPAKRISVAQLNELLVWLQEVQTPDRPTEAPTASSPSPGTSGVTSPAA